MPRPDDRGLSSLCNLNVIAMNRMHPLLNGLVRAMPRGIETIKALARRVTSERLRSRLKAILRKRPPPRQPSGREFTSLQKTVKSWVETRGSQVIALGDKEELPFVPPRFWNASEHPPPTYVTGSLPYVAELPGVTVSFRSSLIITEDRSILNDIGADVDFGDKVSWGYDANVLRQSGKSITFDPQWSRIVEIDGGAMLCGLASNYFGHWVPEFLGRLEWLEQHPLFEELPVIIDGDMPRTHLEYLELVCDRPVVEIAPNTAFRCDRLIYSPPPTFFPVELIPNHNIPTAKSGIFSIGAAKFLQGKVRNKLGDGGTSRLAGNRWFLGRKNMHWRRLSNEDEISHILSTLGFRTIFPEDMTFIEQVELFRDAEAIIAPNGSSLLNVIFARTDVKIIILSQDEVFNWGGYQGPIEALGYRPIWVRGKAISGEKHSDYVVSPSELLSAAAAVGLGDHRRETTHGRRA